MRKKVLTACAVVCTVCVLGAICLGQVNKGRSVSKLVLENIEALTDEEIPSGTCGVAVWSGDSWMICVCNTSFEYAQSIYNDPAYAHLKGTPYLRWCCDSCGDTPYCGSES